MKVIRAQAMQRPHKCLGRHYLQAPEPTPTNGKLVASDKNNPPLLSPPKNQKNPARNPPDDRRACDKAGAQSRGFARDDINPPKDYRETTC